MKQISKFLLCNFYGEDRQEETVIEIGKNISYRINYSNNKNKRNQ